VQDEEQGQAQARNEVEIDNPDEGASSDEDGDAPLFHTGSNV